MLITLYNVKFQSNTYFFFELLILFKISYFTALLDDDMFNLCSVFVF